LADAWTTLAEIAKGASRPVWNQSWRVETRPTVVGGLDAPFSEAMVA
jgi:hypothetical protein